LNYISDKYTAGHGGGPLFPTDKIGKLMSQTANRLIADFMPSYPEVIERIKNREYDRLFLKARFRNLSTLQKKLKDAFIFEDIIQTALAVGYEPSKIVILDTDLSLSESFITRLGQLGISREIPSITMPGMSKRFIDDCLEIHESTSENFKISNLIYYGNLSFENYKEGHSKNTIINDIIESVDGVKMFDNTGFTMTVAAKRDLALENWLSNLNKLELIGREDRAAIWEHHKLSIASINVSKDLYLEKGFIPARVYEAIIFGTIPVSYKKRLHPAMTFDTVDDFWEICKFLEECSRKDYLKILRQCAESL